MESEIKIPDCYLCPITMVHGISSPAIENILYLWNMFHGSDRKYSISVEHSSLQNPHETMFCFGLNSWHFGFGILALLVSWF